MSQATPAARSPRENAVLALGALGVVYGDIGTSPLYTLRACFAGSHPVALTQDNVLGILSLIFWALTIVVTFKYIMFVMRADNNGEGGILSLVALIQRQKLDYPRLQKFMVTSGVFGAATFFGIAIITPALSVLSATEGLVVISPDFKSYVIPITIGLLLGLFSVQRFGTAGVGAMFGPLMLVWFLVLAVLGAMGIAEHPDVLRALNPYYAVHFFVENGVLAFIVVGAVVLAVTGGEALYADMGHFGRVPIQRVWLFFVLPALVMNYFGQGALLLYEPEAIDNPFFHLAPDWFQWTLFVLSTAATIVASQAVITGVFSVMRQAVQLGFWPRSNILHTSTKEIGQIYVPQMNWVMLISVVGLVLIFKTSSNLAAAYGIAVTSEMMVTTMLACIVAITIWKWNRVFVIAIGVVFFSVDALFLTSNLLKFVDGGWVPLLIGIVIMVMMLAWRRGRKVLHDKLQESTLPLEPFIQSLQIDRPVTVPGTAIFMISSPDIVPHALLHNLKHNKVIHERVVLLTIYTKEVPFVHLKNRIEIQKLEGGFYVVKAYYGFKQSADITKLLKRCSDLGLDFNMMETSFFLSRERLIPAAKPSMPIIFERIFSAMNKNAMSATEFFKIPTNRVVELGTQIEI